jgi:hypothetical protein
MWKDKYFWFSQPSSFLNQFDHSLLWVFLGFTIAGVLLRVLAALNKHLIYQKLTRRFASLGLTMGIIGLAWYGLRYENTPIFSVRYWVAIIFLIAIVWLAFILKYLFTTFRSEKREFDRQALNSRYIPGAKK